MTLPAAPVGPLSAHVVRKPILVLLCEHREGVADIRAAPIEKHQLTHEIIQRGAQVVDDLTDDRAPPVGRAGRPSRVDVKAVAAPVAVLVGVNGVGVRLSAERRDILLELGQLLDRSLPLRPDSVHVGCHFSSAVTWLVAGAARLSQRRCDALRGTGLGDPAGAV